MSQDWVKDEIKYIKTGDKRLDKRLEEIVIKTSASPESSLSIAFKNRTELKRYYEFMSNKEVKYEKIMEGIGNRVKERAEKEEKILIMSDTTDLINKGLKDEKNLAKINKKTKGIVVHTSMAVSLEGVPLGIINQTVIKREEEEKKDKRRPIEEKESYKWIEHYKKSDELINKPFIYIGDREADIIELYAIKKEEHDLLIRSSHNRKIENSKLKLHDYLKTLKTKVIIDLELSNRKNELPKKTKIGITYSEVIISIPYDLKGKLKEPVKLYGIHIKEINVDVKEKDKIEWFLLTTIPVLNNEDAIKYVNYYTKRWLIERLHYTLKSGCYIEKLQFKESERLIKALAVYDIVAWRLLWLTYESRKDENQDCSVFFSDIEWKYLLMFVANIKDFSLKPTLKTATVLMSILGGYLNRKSDPPPGVKVIWRGYRVLQERIIAFKEALDFLGFSNIFN
jgi:hypothetical protein